MNINETPNEETNETVSNAEENVVEETSSTEEGVVEESTEEVVTEEPKKKKSKFSFRTGGSKKKDKLAVKVEELEGKIEEVKQEKTELKDKYLRLYAEFDNYKKRTSREKLELTKTASRKVIEGLLPVLDDFDRAKKTAENDDNEEVFTEGVQLVYDKLKTNLTKVGLKPMESNGEVFDPEVHEAITKIPAGDEMSGKVVDTVEKGYYLNDKIIRYAKVVVGQ